jgi:hypothetical protein
MAIPAVTCDAKIVVVWNENAGLYDAALSASATESPTSWTWTILSVPVGLEAILTGVWGDFTDGVAITGVGGTSAVLLEGIPTDVVAGTIVIQAVAVNGEGSSVPTVDRASGQQCVVIKTEMLDLELPGDEQYSWGYGQLDGVLRKLEEGGSSDAVLMIDALIDNTYASTAAWTGIGVPTIPEPGIVIGSFIAKAKQYGLSLSGKHYGVSGSNWGWYRLVFNYDTVPIYPDNDGASGWVWVSYNAWWDWFHYNGLVTLPAGVTTVKLEWMDVGVGQHAGVQAVAGKITLLGW